MANCYNCHRAIKEEIPGVYIHSGTDKFACVPQAKSGTPQYSLMATLTPFSNSQNPTK